MRNCVTTDDVLGHVIAMSSEQRKSRDWSKHQYEFRTSFIIFNVNYVCSNIPLKSFSESDKNTHLVPISSGIRAQRHDKYNQFRQDCTQRHARVIIGIKDH